MLLKMLRSKIHGARVTEANVDYVGSIEIDRELMDAAGLLVNELVMVADLDNGQRLETYVIEGQAGSGTVAVNGAAARLIHKGDTVLIFSFAYLSPEEAADHQATIVIPDENNKVKDIRRNPSR